MVRPAKPRASYFAVSGGHGRGRGRKKAPSIGEHLLFSFLTTEPNSIVEPLYEEAMPG